MPEHCSQMTRQKSHRVRANPATALLACAKMALKQLENISVEEAGSWVKAKLRGAFPKKIRPVRLV